MTSCDNDCHVSLPIVNILPTAANGEIHEFSDVKTPSVCDDHTTYQVDPDTATPSDTCSSQVTDHSCADSASADITVEHVIDSDIPVAASTFDSEINFGEKVGAESTNTELIHEMSCDSEAKKIAVDSTQQSTPTSDASPPAESTDEIQLNHNDNKDQPRSPNTMLSWSDQPSDVTTSKTKCAIQFENSVIFDLDVE